MTVGKAISMDVRIKEVSTQKELKAFVGFQYKLYRKHPYWVPPLFLDEVNTLRWDKNPAFEHSKARYWLAYRDGQIVGRIAAILNQPHIEKWGERYMRFGWVDFIDDPAVSAALFEKVETWAREQSLTAVHGPLGFTDMDPEGMLVEGFDELGTLVGIYNYPYYPVHLENLGYGKDTDWVEYELQVPAEPDERVAKLSKLLLKRYNLHMLDVKNKKEMLLYAGQLFDLLGGVRQSVRICADD